MTVISLLISRVCTVHATDSLLTEIGPNGTLVQKEHKKAKIVRVEHFRGAMAYWGGTIFRWGATEESLHELLTERSKQASRYSSAEEFANAIGKELTRIVRPPPDADMRHFGIGIHFSAYELVDDIWIPELFLISNWTNTNYEDVHKSGFHVSRETYGNVAHIIDRLPEHRDAHFRLEVDDYLKQPWKILIYNNGDPIMFNAATEVIRQYFKILRTRGVLKRNLDVEMMCKIARMPIDLVKRSQSDFCEPQTQRVGGKVHTLAITPNGTYH